MYRPQKIRKCVEIDSGTHAVPYPMCIGGSFPGSNVAGGVKLTIHVHLGLRLRLCEAIHLISYTLQEALLDYAQ